MKVSSKTDSKYTVAGVSSRLVAMAMLFAATQDSNAADIVSRRSASQGQELFTKHCEACHGAGFDKPGTLALAVRDGPTQAAELRHRESLSPAFLRTVARIGVGNMPPFRKTEVSDQELEVLVNWLSRRPSTAVN